MSISFIPETNFDFPDGYNVKLLIIGLAVCSLDSPKSTIRFLRGIPEHKLKLEIRSQNSSGGSCVEENKFLDGVKTIDISGTGTVSGYEYNPVPQKNKLKNILNLWKLHGHKLDERPIHQIPLNRRPTNLEVNNCLFFTEELTACDFDIVENGTPRNTISKFGEIMGGYMKIPSEGGLIITLDSNRQILLPFNTSGEDCKYEIRFINSCFKPDDSLCDRQIPPPLPPTDFVYIYDILMDSRHPNHSFDLKAENCPEPTINTGACLPVILEPEV